MHGQLSCLSRETGLQRRAICIQPKETKLPGQKPITGLERQTPAARPEWCRAAYSGQKVRKGGKVIAVVKRINWEEQDEPRGRLARRAACRKRRIHFNKELTLERCGAKRHKLRQRHRSMPRPLRVFFRRNNRAITHMDNAVSHFGCLGIVCNHQHGLPKLLVGVAQHLQYDV